MYAHNAAGRQTNNNNNLAKSTAKSKSKSQPMFVELVQRKPAEVVVVAEVEVEAIGAAGVATPRMQFGIIERQVRKVANKKYNNIKKKTENWFPHSCCYYVLTFCHGLLPVLLPAFLGMEFWL